jgi:hypothetical protein
VFGLDTKLTFDLLGESQTADGDCFPTRIDPSRIPKLEVPELISLRRLERSEAVERLELLERAAVLKLNDLN